MKVNINYLLHYLHVVYLRVLRKPILLPKLYASYNMQYFRFVERSLACFAHHCEYNSLGNPGYLFISGLFRSDHERLG